MQQKPIVECVNGAALALAAVVTKEVEEKNRINATTATTTTAPTGMAQAAKASDVNNLKAINWEFQDLSIYLGL